MVFVLKDVIVLWKRKKVIKLCLDIGNLGNRFIDLDIELVFEE